VYASRGKEEGKRPMNVYLIGNVLKELIGLKGRPEAHN